MLEYSVKNIEHHSHKINVNTQVIYRVYIYIYTCIYSHKIYGKPSSNMGHMSHESGVFSEYILDELNVVRD